MAESLLNALQFGRKIIEKPVNTRRFSDFTLALQLAKATDEQKRKHYVRKNF